MNAPESLVYELPAALEIANWPGDYSRELCIHCYVGKVVHDAADRLQLFVEILLPYLSDAKNFTGGRFGSHTFQNLGDKALVLSSKKGNLELA